MSISATRAMESHNDKQNRLNSWRIGVYPYVKSLVLLIFIGSTPNLFAASFSCAAAKTDVEKQVCSDPELSAMDSEMAMLFSSLLARERSNSSALIEGQRAWLRKRNTAQRLQAAYGDRIIELRNMGAYSTPFIPDKGHSPEDFIPQNYKIGEKVEADLNDDGLNDTVLLLWESPSSYKPRPLLILLREPHGGYILSLRTDRFTLDDTDTCGAGNNYCVPDIRAVNGHLAIRLRRGSASGYDVHEKEFGLLQGRWYELIRKEYGLGQLDCTEVHVPENLRCFESGVIDDLTHGRLTRYWKITTEKGSERTIRSKEEFPKEPLKEFHEVSEWEKPLMPTTIEELMQLQSDLEKKGIRY